MLWLPHSSKPPTQSALLLPLRNTVLLPGITLPVVVGRPRSIASAEAAMETAEKQVVIAAIRPNALERPWPKFSE